jgi:hypothetical protein
MMSRSDRAMLAALAAELEAAALTEQLATALEQRDRARSWGCLLEQLLHLERDQSAALADHVMRLQVDLDEARMAVELAELGFLRQLTREQGGAR